MRATTTDGRIVTDPDMCPYCRLDTAGAHEAGCPLLLKWRFKWHG